MAFELFDRVTSGRPKVTEPMVSVSCIGQVSFLTEAVKQYNISDHCKHVGFYFDKSDNRIGFKFFDDEQSFTRKLRIRTVNNSYRVTISLKMLFAYYKLVLPKKTERFRLFKEASLLYFKLGDQCESRQARR